MHLDHLPVPIIVLLTLYLKGPLRKLLDGLAETSLIVINRKLAGGGSASAQRDKQGKCRQM